MKTTSAMIRVSVGFRGIHIRYNDVPVYFTLLSSLDLHLISFNDITIILLVFVVILLVFVVILLVYFRMLAWVTWRLSRQIFLQLHALPITNPCIILSKVIFSYGQACLCRMSEMDVTACMTVTFVYSYHVMWRQEETHSHICIHNLN